MTVDPVVLRKAAAAGSHIYPYATVKLLPEAATQAAITPWSFILHTMGGSKSASAAALWNYISQETVRGEPHMLLGYADIIQAIPFNVRADNNAKANQWFVGGQSRGAISVETQDDGTDKDPSIAKSAWNEFQLEHLAGIAAFLNLRYGNPIERCVTWDGRGVDGHRAFPEWSIYTGKTCPGETRWHQIPDILVRARALVQPIPNPDTDTENRMYFTISRQPATLWERIPNTNIAVRVDPSTLPALGLDYSKVPIINPVEAAKLTFLGGFPFASVR